MTTLGNEIGKRVSIHGCIDFSRYKCSSRRAQGTINITRSNTQTQSNAIEQEACTNEQEDDAENQEGDDDQVAIAVGGNQSNDCVVVQNATASNSAAIVDLSDNDINASLANLDLEELIALGDL